MPLDIIVVGAGIAGLTCAASLRQAGHHVQILEKSAFATEVGAALVLSPNGVRVLRRLGFDLARALAYPVQHWDVLDGTTLERIARLDMTGAEARFGSGLYAIHRVDLHTELLRLATGEDAELKGQPATLRLGAGVVDIADDGTVTLVDGEKVSADVVVGADGVRSVVRDYVLGTEAAAAMPVHSGQAAFRFLVETKLLEDEPELAPLLERTKGLVNMLDDVAEKEMTRHMMWYGCHGGKIQNFVGIHPSTSDTIQEGEEQKIAMRKEFSHFDSRISKLISLSSHIKRWPLLLHTPYERWTRGNVVLIGDAAHPMIPFGGQGSNSAIEDGCALGLLLQRTTTPSEIGTRLAQFQTLRRNRTARVQYLSSVPAGREKQVEAQVRQYADSPETVIPTSHAERSVHDYSYDVFAECDKLVALHGE